MAIDKMIVLAGEDKCTGCAACQQSCTHAAISMKENREGFLFPKINKDKCVGCGLCVRRCPELSPIKRLDYSVQKSYAVINNEYRKQSSSGGAFSLLAGWVIRQGGVVFGAAYDNRLTVKHIAVDTMADLCKLRGSKYVQSDVGNSYKQVKSFLANGRKVLFSGTGCQVAGLYAYLDGKRYNGQLFTIDLVCHGVPSLGAFRCYLSKLSHVLGDRNISGFRFRKLDSWSIIPAVQLSETKWRLLRLSENVYMDAFFEGITFRESCFHCQYCNTQRIGTFTLADFWGIGRHGKHFSRNVASGVSLVIDNIDIMPTIKAELKKYAYIEERSMEEAMAEQRNLKMPMPRSTKRDTAVKDLMDKRISLADFAKKYGYPYRITLKTTIIGVVKNMIYALGLYNMYKTIIYKIGK